MGARFCATREAPIHPRIKQLLVDGDERATQLIFRSFRNTGRVAKNTVSEEVARLGERPGASFEDVRSLVSGAKGRVALETGDVEAGLIWAGQVQGIIRHIPTCGALIDRIVGEAALLIDERLAKLRE